MCVLLIWKIQKKAEANIKIEFASDGNNQRVYADGEDITSRIRDEEVGNGASVVSAYSGVRNAMLIKQREMGKSGGVVMEGRDIGTVGFPNANIKFFLAASAEERGRRRHLELEEKGENVERDRIVEDIRKRDNKDASREIAPLRRADDSIVI